ncbi:MAG: type I polyketide synthase, partial [Candidatus Angelobacter sp.]
YWENLKNGIEGISFFSDGDMEVEVDSKDLRNPAFVKAKGVIDDIDVFDGAFFNIPAREADWMDPQQRLFLQAAWEALEHAGYNPLACPGQVSVYAGANTNTYLLGRLAQLQVGDPASYFRILLSNEKDHLATRVSYKLDLRGESITVQTSCSTSLVAVHLACQSILSGQSTMALAGGISVRVPQKAGYFYQEGMMASPDGHCRPFDAQAKGTVPGHGYGIVVLKLMIDAIRDRDTIYAVIKGSAANNDGRNKVGYTAPAVEGQRDVIARALAMSGVNAEEISFVEAHGTGTPLGDPIEVEALTQAYRRHTLRKQYCVLGAVKSSIGHLDSAAGVAGLIKTVLALRHQQIPPTLHFETPNPMLNLENSPFRVTNRLLDWQAGSAPRIAGLSSFGIGGTNVHMIVVEASKLQSERSMRPQTVTLSARSVERLKTMAGQLGAHLGQESQQNPADVAFTRNVGRQSFAYRAYAVGSTSEEIIASLKSIESRPEDAFVAAPEGAPKVAFLFPGQGIQKIGMGQQIYETEPEFRQCVDECFDYVRDKFGVDLYGCLYKPLQDQALAARQLAQPGTGLPALFTIEYALARLWMSWGLKPHGLIGPSFGEYVAACVAGVFSLEEALWLATMRGRLMEKLPPGAMTAVRLSADELPPLLTGTIVAVAAVNSRKDCTISGPLTDVERVEKRLEQKSVGHRRLDVPYAYHSSLVGSILEEFGEVAAGISFSRPTLPFISSVTGTWIDEQQAITPKYWVEQMRQTVQFARGIDVLQQDSFRLYLEVA